MTNEKRLKIEHVKIYINSLTRKSSDARKWLKPYNGDELDNMTIEQIEMLLLFIKSAYDVGHTDARMGIYD